MQRKAWIKVETLFPARTSRAEFHHKNTQRLKEALVTAPMEREKRKTSQVMLDTKTEHAKRSDVKPREVITCKKRPYNNIKKGSGSGKRFVPWCG